ncbi:MAG: SDR family oxidoreductase [Actinobacteria bacterium]|nr:SDR family oxidoreductase [Actinomycetota bacterium]
MTAQQAAAWTVADIPDQSGRTALVTGANSGLGYQVALQLARRGARVLVGARNRARGEAALAKLATEAPGSNAELAELDLADLGSVERFAAGITGPGQELDLLVNNGGVMAIPHRETTAQGFERQFGTNHLGHFALTARLLPVLAQRPGSRVVTVSSEQHKRARGIGFDDLQAERGYRPWGAYQQSKLANAMFVLELDRRLRAAGLDVVSAGAHPGFAATNLQFAGPRSGGTGLQARALGLATRLYAQPVSDGAVPLLYAATAPGVSGGEYFGPSGPGERRGRHPRQVQFSAAARDQAAAGRLWRVSEELAGVSFGILKAS